MIGYFNGENGKRTAKAKRSKWKGITDAKINQTLKRKKRSKDRNRKDVETTLPTNCIQSPFSTLYSTLTAFPEVVRYFRHRLRGKKGIGVNSTIGIKRSIRYFKRCDNFVTSVSQSHLEIFEVADIIEFLRMDTKGD